MLINGAKRKRTKQIDRSYFQTWEFTRIKLEMDGRRKKLGSYTVTIRETDYKRSIL